MNITRIKEIADKLSDARKALYNAKSVHQGLIDVGKQQSQISIKAGGYYMEITEMDNYYRQSLKRGYDMIHLGMVKVASAEVDRISDICKSLEDQLAAEVSVKS